MEIHELLVFNPWWEEPEAINRDEKILRSKNAGFSWDRKNLLELKPGVQIIKGPRQIGKTTWIKMRIKDLLKKTNKKNVFYLPCDALEDKKELQDIVLRYVKWAKGKRYIFLDEISSIDDWEHAIKVIVDAGFAKENCFILTGSSSINLLAKGERLPGRLASGKAVHIFYPMMFNEYIQSRGIRWKNYELHIDELNNYLMDYLHTGGIPAVLSEYLRSGCVTNEMLSVYGSWILGEIANARKSTNIGRHILKEISKYYSTPISWAKLSEDIISPPTAADYVETFEKLFILNYIYNIKTSGEYFSKQKKIYFLDPFFYSVSAYLKAKKPSIDSEIAGKLIEGVVLTHLISALDGYYRMNDFDYKNYVYFYKTKTGKEIDFVVKLKDRYIPIEVKWSKTGKTRALQLNRFGGDGVALALFLLNPLHYLEKSKIYF